jgi:hypothetical protein
MLEERVAVAGRETVVLCPEMENPEKFGEAGDRVVKP